MTKKRIDTYLHYAQYIIARMILVSSIVPLIHSIWTQRIDGIIFSSLFIIYMIIMIKRIFNKPTRIEFDDNYIYLENGNERIELNNITGIRKNRIFYESDGIESQLKLPNIYFMDKNWAELKELINRKKH